MLNLREFQNRAKGFPDLLNLALTPENGIVQTKSGGLMASWYFRGKDTASSTNSELASLSSRLNAILCKFGEGWMLHVDAIRRTASDYPERGAFPDRTTLIIDEERRQQFLQEGRHYESFYTITVTYHPPKRIKRRLADFVYEGGAKGEQGYASRILTDFKKHIQDFESIASSIFLIRRMVGIKTTDDFGKEHILDEQLQYLHHCISGILQPIKLPSIPMYLDVLLGSYEFIGGNEPKIGDKWIKVIAIEGFPQESYPGILSNLDDLAIEYRWSTRFIFYEPYQARKLLEKVRKKWAQKQRGLKDQIFNTASGPVDLDAIEMTRDVEQALGEAESSLVKYGNYTSVIVLMNEDHQVIQEDARKVRNAIMNAGYSARVEEPNSVEAYLGSIPGHHYPNIRRPLLHTLNLADMLPITSIWAGLEYNPNPLFPPNSPALCYAATTGSTPFRFNIHISDLGHTLLLGRPGGGKSTALAFMMAQYFRYPNAQVFAFDKGYSAYVLSKAAGGYHYDIGAENSSLCFCPLQHIDTENDRAWAIEWLETLLTFQGIKVTSTVTNTLREAIVRLAGSTTRSLTEYRALVQSTELKDAIAPYTLEGTMGHILDAQEDTLRTGRFQVFELEHLLELGEKNYAPVLLYLFRQIEKRLDGRPTLVPIDEAWIALMVDVFREKVVKWLREWRKKNAAVILATQNISDVVNSPLRDLLLTACGTKIILPNPEANTSTLIENYRAIGFNNREIDLIANATEKLHYYYTSPLGRRLFSFGFGEVALSFIGTASEEARKTADRFIERHGEMWPVEWLRSRGLEDWADYWYRVQ